MSSVHVHTSCYSRKQHTTLHLLPSSKFPTILLPLWREPAPIRNLAPSLPLRNWAQPRLDPLTPLRMLLLARKLATSNRRSRMWVVEKMRFTYLHANSFSLNMGGFVSMQIDLVLLKCGCLIFMQIFLQNFGCHIFMQIALCYYFLLYSRWNILLNWLFLCDI